MNTVLKLDECHKKQMDKNAKIYFVHKNAREGYCNISKI